MKVLRWIIMVCGAIILLYIASCIVTLSFLSTDQVIDQTIKEMDARDLKRLPGPPGPPHD